MEFTDELDRVVTLHLGEDHPEILHVLVIPKFKDKYVLTKHKERGLEFPGGKVEHDEHIEQAAIRELYEETGATIRNLKYVGYYQVHAEKPFHKAVYFAEVDEITDKDNYLESNGYSLFKDIRNINNDEMSFLLTDECIRYLYEMSEQDEFFEAL